MKTGAGTAAIGSYAANELFRSQYASKLGWNSRACGRIRIIGYIRINNSGLNQVAVQPVAEPVTVFIGPVLT
jgi:hypothetical protein